MSAEAEQPSVAETPSCPPKNEQREEKPSSSPVTSDVRPEAPKSTVGKADRGDKDTTCSSASTVSSWVSETEGSHSTSGSSSGILTLSSTEQSLDNWSSVLLDSGVAKNPQPENRVAESDSADTLVEKDDSLWAALGVKVNSSGQPLLNGHDGAGNGAIGDLPNEEEPPIYDLVGGPQADADQARPQAGADQAEIQVDADPAGPQADAEPGAPGEPKLPSGPNGRSASDKIETIEFDGRFGIVPYKWLDPLCKPLRAIVSQNRRRYIDDVNNFNLDLTYITDRIIAMGYPSHETESLYRNTMLSTVYFLQQFHDKHFMVFNLRGEYIYDAANFQYRVSAYEMTDHHPPRLELMKPFCEEMHTYLETEPENVVAVHCKAGKGRTGVMICAYLTYIRLYPTARQCMDYYSIVRTHNNKGVTIPSQRRYIYYFEHMLNHGLTYTPYQNELVAVYIEQPPQNGRFSNLNALSISVSCGDVELYTSPPMVLSREVMDEENQLTEKFPNYQGDDSYDFNHRFSESTGNVLSRRCFGWTLSPDQRIFLEGDVCIRILRSSTSLDKSKKSSLKSKKLGHIWFNTMFSCPHYCQVPYVHGDEANPYPEDGTTIARKISGDESEVSSTNKGDQQTCSKNMKKSKKISHKYEINEPPGLEQHCPNETVAMIHRKSLEAPRISIRKMLEKAHEKNLVSDDYNERRKAAQGSGEPIPKAPIGRPNANGPFCVVRSGDEHGAAYRTIEVDKVCKTNNVPAGFKVIIVTRCIDRTIKQEVDLAETRIQAVRHSQRFYEAQKRQEMHAKIETKVKKNMEARKNSRSKIMDLFKRRKDSTTSEDTMRRELEHQMRTYLFPHRPGTSSPELYFRCPNVCPPEISDPIPPPAPGPSAARAPSPLPGPSSASAAASAPPKDPNDEGNDHDVNRTITSGSYFRPAGDIFDRVMAEEDESPEVEEDSE